MHSGVNVANGAIISHQVAVQDITVIRKKSVVRGIVLGGL